MVRGVVWVAFHFFVGFGVVPKNRNRPGQLLLRNGEIAAALLAAIADRQRTIARGFTCW
ncbi:MAG: hypothetical protein ABI613_05745 [Gemmatimonadota bacterium]